MTLQALIFDVDGTLADTERDGHRVAFNAAFRDAGLDWVWDEALYGELLAVTGGKERIRRYIDTCAPSLPPHADVGELIARLHAAKTAHYVRLVDAGAVQLRPGIARLLNEARRAGLRLAIATTTTPDNVTALLRATLGEQAADWFDVIGAGDVVPAKKPAPDIYHWVLERLSLPPAHCLALEDSAAGLAASLTAGVPTVVTHNAYTSTQDFTGAIAVMPSLGADNAPDAVSLAMLRNWHRASVEASDKTYAEDKKR